MLQFKETEEWWDRQMKIQLEGITMLSKDVARLAHFYRDVLGFRIVVEEADYVEFDNSGVRLAICSTPLMADNTNDHPSFLEDRKAQRALNPRPFCRLS